MRGRGLMGNGPGAVAVAAAGPSPDPAVATGAEEKLPRDDTRGTLEATESVSVTAYCGTRLGSIRAAPVVLALPPAPAPAPFTFTFAFTFLWASSTWTLRLLDR